MHNYSFKTTFTIGTDLKNIWHLFIDYQNWPRWWKSIKKIEVGTDSGMVILNITIHKFFYDLHFQLRAEEIDVGKRIFFLSSGDLEGTGEFLFGEADRITSVTFLWNVKTTKWWMNTAAPVARPVFIFSHEQVMNDFIYGIGKELHAKILQHKTEAA